MSKLLSAVVAFVSIITTTGTFPLNGSLELSGTAAVSAAASCSYTPKEYFLVQTQTSVCSVGFDQIHLEIIASLCHRWMAGSVVPLHDTLRLTG